MTRSALQSDQVRHEVVVEVYDTIDVDIDPNANLLYNLDMENKMCCTVLTSKGYDGSQFKIHAPRLVKSKTLATTKPQNFEWVKEIADSKAAGQMFYTTGGQHLNSDDFFKSRALLDRRLHIKELQYEKNAIAERISIRNDKDALLRRIGKELTEETKKDFKVTDIKVLLKWELEKNPTGNRQSLLM